MGVLPVLAIIGYLTFYARHNLKFSWQKSPSIASYVLYLFLACTKGDGSRNNNIATISENVPYNSNNNNDRSKLRRNIDITPTGLISTTNHEGINKSTSINVRNNDVGVVVENKRSLSFKALRSSLKLNTNLKFTKQTNNNKDKNSSLLECRTPDTAETIVSTPEIVSYMNVRKLASQFDKRNNEC